MRFIKNKYKYAKDLFVYFIKGLGPRYRLLLALFLSVLIMFLTTVCLNNYINKKVSEQFTKDTYQIRETLNNSFDKYKELLSTMHSFIASSDTVSSVSYQKYTSSLDLLNQYPALHLLDYAVPVTIENLNNFYQDLAKENEYNDGDFYYSIAENIIKENRKNINYGKENHYIVKYVEPLANGYPYIGFDLTESPRLEKLLIDSDKSGKVISSGRVFIDRRAKAYHFVTLRQTVSAKENPVTNGSIGVSIRLDNSLFSELNNNLKYINFQIMSPEEEGKTLIYDSRFKRRTIDIPWDKDLFDENNIQMKRNLTFKIGDRDFTIYMFSNNIPPNTMDKNVLFVASMLAFIFSFYAIYWGGFKRIERMEESKIEKEKTAKLRKQAHTDELTGLGNRRALFSDLEDSIKNYPSEIKKLFFLDLDGFKRVNDTLGHAAGDLLLKDYVKRLLNMNIPASFYRIGGDEFLVFLEQHNFEKELTQKLTEELASRFLLLTKESFKVQGETFLLSQSIGISEYPLDSGTPEDLFKNSDMAMYEAKNDGKNCYRFFAKGLSEKASRKNKMINLLQEALIKDEFYLVFQPQIRKNSEGKYYVNSVEALLRWNNTSLGYISPADFIPLAEEMGIMIDICSWIINEVGKTIAFWKKNGLSDINVSVNISAHQLSNELLPGFFHITLAQYGVPSSQVTIEITESSVMKEPEKSKKVITNFRNEGFGISIDDFGTGHSSLSYLKELPVTELKIDKSFTDEILEQKGGILIESIVSMAQKLQLEIVIEGVEENTQVVWVETNLENVCIQGYYFSKPIVALDLLDYIKHDKANKIA